MRPHGHLQHLYLLLPVRHTSLLTALQVKNLSGGELQRVALILCLGKPADVYLIDEPSAYLDSEQRIVASKIIKRFILHAKKTAFIVEHDFIMATFLADQVRGRSGMFVEQWLLNWQVCICGSWLSLTSAVANLRRSSSTTAPRVLRRLLTLRSPC